MGKLEHNIIDSNTFPAFVRDFRTMTLEGIWESSSGAEMNGTNIWHWAKLYYYFFTIQNLNVKLYGHLRCPELLGVSCRHLFNLISKIWLKYKRNVGFQPSRLYKIFLNILNLDKLLKYFDLWKKAGFLTFRNLFVTGQVPSFEYFSVKIIRIKIF